MVERTDDEAQLLAGRVFAVNRQIRHPGKLQDLCPQLFDIVSGTISLSHNNSTRVSAASYFDEMLEHDELLLLVARSNYLKLTADTQGLYDIRRPYEISRYLLNNLTAVFPQLYN